MEVKNNKYLRDWTQEIDGLTGLSDHRKGSFIEILKKLTRYTDLKISLDHQNNF